VGEGALKILAPAHTYRHTMDASPVSSKVHTLIERL
jgi:hypothetical protein